MSENFDKKIASIVRKELKNENFDDDSWLKAFKKAEGDEQKAKVYYIDFRTSDLKKQAEKEKKAEDLKTNTHVQCGRSFCVNRYQILSIPKKSFSIQLCEGCGNKLDQKIDEKSALKELEQKKFQTSENKNIKSKQQSDRVQQKIVEKIWWGNEAMSSIFWMYCIVGGLVVGIITGALTAYFGSFILIVLGIYIVWANTGLWRSSDKYKQIKIKNNQDYGWATGAKIYVVLSYIVSVSQLGHFLRELDKL